MAITSYAETRVTKWIVQADPRTGKLVRIAVSTSDAPPVQPAKLKELVDSISESQQVEASLVHSVIRAESNYNSNAVSPKGAQGLMQLIPSTARRFGVIDSFDAAENIQGGVKYLKYLIGLYKGDYTRAIAAYNAGEAAVAKYGGVPPYKETRNYVAEVGRHLDAARRAVTTPVKPLALAPAPADAAVAIVASLAPDGRIFYRTP